MSEEKRFGEKIFDLVCGKFARFWLERNGKHEIVEKDDAVAFMIYHRDRDQVVFVSQLRLPIMSNLIEAPAGHIDYPKETLTDYEIKKSMAREAKEELGIVIDPHQIEYVCFNGLCTSPGILTERIYLGYMEIGNDDIESEERVFGLAEEGEQIKRIWISLDNLETFANKSINDMKTFALVQWFLRVKYPQLPRPEKGV
ncbi:MAG: NUDIX hydrolase [Candidatus Buchananbacteria bacterium]|jgi:8-oxo-dGTP pyrophosphatase MutT (NUDIX family)